MVELRGALKRKGGYATMNSSGSLTRRLFGLMILILILSPTSFTLTEQPGWSIVGATVVIDGCVTDNFADESLVAAYSDIHVFPADVHLCDCIMPSNTTDIEGRWGFNEGSGTTAEDTSGNDIDGVITGATYIQGIDYHVGTPPGFLRYALRFNDTEGDFVNITYADPINNTLPYSIEFWFRPRLQQVNVTGTIVSGGYAFFVYYDNATESIIMSYYNGGTWEILSSAGGLGAGYTYVVCEWRDETPKTNMTMWFNATVRATELLVGMPDGELLNANVYIGRNGTQTTDGFLSGDIDVVRYYNRTLSGAEVSENYVMLVDAGVLYSTNMLSGLNVTWVVDFRYNATVYTGGNIYLSFSQDNATWVDSDGLSSTEALVNGSNSIVLTGLDWSGRIYYRAQFNRTEGVYVTPTLYEVAVCYTTTGGVGGWNILIVVVLVAAASVAAMVGRLKRW